MTNTTDREEQIKDMLKRLVESTGVYAIAFAGDAINETETKLRTDTLIHDCTEKILAWHEQKVAEAVSKDKILNNPDEFVDYIKTNGGEFIEKAPSITDEKI